MQRAARGGRGERRAPADRTRAASRWCVAADGRVVGAVVAHARRASARCARAAASCSPPAASSTTTPCSRATRPGCCAASCGSAATATTARGIRLGMAAGAEAIRHATRPRSRCPITPPQAPQAGPARESRRASASSTRTPTTGGPASSRCSRQDGAGLADRRRRDPSSAPDGAGSKLRAVGRDDRGARARARLPGGHAPGDRRALQPLRRRPARIPLFHKAPEHVAPLVKPPFGAFDCTVEHALYAAFTLGGLRTRPSGAVLDARRRGDPGPLRRRAHHLGRVRAGLQQRALARRRELLRPSRRGERGSGLRRRESAAKRGLAVASAPSALAPGDGRCTVPGHCSPRAPACNYSAARVRRATRTSGVARSAWIGTPRSPVHQTLEISIGAAG